MATCTVTVANTIVTGTNSSTTVNSGDFLVWELTAGACAALASNGAAANF
jgi:hypothetical protein